MRAPASRTLAISSAWRGRSRMQTTRSAISPFFGLREVLQVFGRCCVEIDDVVRQAAADRNLVHVDIGRIQKAAVIGHRQHRQRVAAALCGDRRAFKRVERDVDLRPVTGADLFADIQHRRLVALAFADHHGAVDREAVQPGAHRIDRRLVGRLFVAAPHQPRRRQRRQFGDAHNLEREIAIHMRHVGHSFPPLSITIGRHAGIEFITTEARRTRRESTHRTNRRNPCLRATVLKFINSPTRRPLRRR